MHAGEVDDYQHYTPKDLATVRDSPKFRVVQASWAEKRKNIDDAIASLPEPMRTEAQQRLRAVQPVAPDRAGLRRHPAGSAIETAHWVIALDPKTGAIQRLRVKRTRREWASEAHPLALFRYQTLAKADYDRYFADYIVIKEPWVGTSFGKPRIEDFGAESRIWVPALGDCWSGRVAGGHRLLAQMRIDDTLAEKSGVVAWPGNMYLDVFLPEAEPMIRLDFLCFAKAANRLPEAMWLSFVPDAPEPHGWSLEKVGQRVSPFDVVRGGNRQMHAVSGDVRYQDTRGRLTIEPLDAPVVALGELSPLAYSTSQPDIAKGIHFSLYNNAWGTNYIQWSGEDTRFRFVLRAG
jgi:hypothetical protein